jgi:hypothetical protein
MLKRKRLWALPTSLLAAVAGALLVLSVPARADFNLPDRNSRDPLHGYCAPAATECIDNGNNSPTTVNPPSNFGFTLSSGSATGDLRIEVLLPDNQSKPTTFSLTGTLVGTATLFSSTPWTSGGLDAYLGISASPATPIGQYLGPCGATKPCTLDLDPGATGYFVYNVDFASATLQGNGSPNVSPLENISPQLPQGSFITGFFNNSIATSNSGAIFEKTRRTPEPGTLALFASALAIFASVRTIVGRVWRRNPV